jgi:UDP-N-acetylglucosamine:LPS N-acetylglucosamine transferase
MTSNVLILSSNTGGGHRSAAQALEESFLRGFPGQVMVSIAQVLEEASVLTRMMADMYNWLLRHRQSWMHYYFDWVEQSRVNEWPLVFQSAFHYAKRLFERVCPDVLVSVHPMTQHFFAYVCRKLGMDIPLVTVVTDPAPGFWSAWACPQVARYYVASQPAKQQLTQFGIDPQRVYITGMPVRQGFEPVADKTLLREQLGLASDPFTLLMSAGYVGGGHVPQLFDGLMDAHIDNTQIIYLTGKNTHLYDHAMRLKQSRPNSLITPVGYVPNMAPWLQASDAIVTKLGGLTTFEALACGVPVLADCVKPPMPQEAQTVDYLTGLGAAIPITGVESFVQLMHTLPKQPDVLARMRQQGSQLVLPGAADAIAQDVMTLAPGRVLPQAPLAMATLS